MKKGEGDRGTGEMGMGKENWEKSRGWGIKKGEDVWEKKKDWEQRRWLGMEKGELGLQKMVGN